MSSALVTGNFGLYAARHTLMKTTTSNGPGTPFYIYTLQLQLSANNGTPMDGTVRVYAPASTEPLPDGTVAYIMVKVHVSPDVGGVMLEPIYFFPYPGLLEDDGYEVGIPDMLGTTFTGLGTVVQNGPRSFVLKLSEFLRGGMQASMVGYVWLSAYLGVVDGDQGDDIDEIEEYWNARFLTSGEATWRIRGYHLNSSRPRPSIS